MIRCQRWFCNLELVPTGDTSPEALTHGQTAASLCCAPKLYAVSPQYFLQHLSYRHELQDIPGTEVHQILVPDTGTEQSAPSKTARPIVVPFALSLVLTRPQSASGLCIHQHTELSNFHGVFIVKTLSQNVKNCTHEP